MLQYATVGILFLKHSVEEDKSMSIV